ncbi:MAG TPA: hypothetical protein VJ983_02560 [candidate division Zixibacteria bacterium]|nr:hypothetical protein [candidate division Zixibacteria bacterium]
MKSGLILLLGLLLTVFGGVALAGDIPGVTFPSDEAVEQAYDAGDISYDDYLILIELMTVGLDSTNLYLLEQISQSGLRLLETDSTEYSTTSISVSDRFNGMLRHSYSKYLEDEGDVKYQSSLKLKLNPRIETNLKLKREYSGRERVVYRSVSYCSQDNRWQFTAGNFSERFGLGGAFGYRGKLLDCSTEIDRESWLFPDYGGHNGIAVDLRAGQWTFRNAYSTHRDSNYRLTTFAAMTQYRLNRFTLGVVAVQDRLTGRIENSSTVQEKLSFWTEYASRRLTHSIEIVSQTGSSGGPKAAITDGRYTIEPLKVRFTGWWYAPDFFDISSGSKTGTVSRRLSLEEPDFEMYSHRSGQRGGKVQSGIKLPSRLRLDFDAEITRLNRDSADFQWSAEVSREISSANILGLECYQRQKRRVDISPTFSRKNRLRVSFRHGSKSVRLQQAFGYSEETDLPNRFSVFIRLLMRIPSYGEVEIWSSLSQANTATHQVENWYGFLRNQFLLARTIVADVKFGRYYRRSSLPHYKTAVTFSLEYRI